MDADEPRIGLNRQGAKNARKKPQVRAALAPHIDADYGYGQKMHKIHKIFITRTHTALTGILKTAFEIRKQDKVLRIRMSRLRVTAHFVKESF